MTEVEELKVKLEEQKERIELLKTMMQNLGDISKSEKAKEYFTLLQNKSTITKLIKTTEDNRESQ